MKIRLMTALLLTSGLTIGCVKDQNQSHRDEANATDAPAAPEPALTANTHFAAGQVAESQGDPARAANQYEEAVKIDPKEAIPLFRLGIIYTTNQKFDLAINAWNRYIKATNGAAAGYSNLGYCLELADRPRDAETAYKTGIAREPRSEACRVNYGLMLAHEGKLDDAVAQMRVVLSTSKVHYNLASVLESQGKKVAARAEYQKALAADPEMTDAKSRLAALDPN